MNEVAVIIIFVAWYAGALVLSENLGSRSRLGVENSFIICILFSPVLGSLITWLYIKRVPSQEDAHSQGV